MNYDVFISFKQTDSFGRETPDCALAEQLYYALEAAGIHTFFSKRSIAREGASRYARKIDEALEQSRILVAVGTKKKYLTSDWVYDEIDAFRGEMNCGNKPEETCALISLVGGELARDKRKLPMFLRKYQAVDSVEEALAFIKSKLGKQAAFTPAAPPFQRFHDPLDDAGYTEILYRPDVTDIPAPPPRKTEYDLLAVGRSVRGYRLLEQMQMGGGGKVFLAENSQTSAKVILKATPPASSYNPFSDTGEASLMAKLSHPAIPQIYEIRNSAELNLVIMEYIPGITLAQALEENGPFDEYVVQDFALQLCDVLAYIHEKQIIHRDLKPANLMLTPGGKLMLIDFGSALSYDGTTLSDTTWEGTRGYAAPEQFGGKSDLRTDQYAMGIILFELCTGRSPRDPYFTLEPLRQVEPRFSCGLEELISRCASTDPNRRFQTDKELLYAFECINQTNRELHKKRLLSRLQERMRQGQTGNATLSPLNSAPLPPAAPLCKRCGRSANSYIFLEDGPVCQDCYAQS